MGTLVLVLKNPSSKTAADGILHICTLIAEDLEVGEILPNFSVLDFLKKSNIHPARKLPSKSMPGIKNLQLLN